MAEAATIPDEVETRARWGAFAWAMYIVFGECDR